MPLDDLERMGFKVAVDPTSSLALAGHAMRALVAAWRGEGSVEALRSRMLTFQELKAAVGVGEVLGWGCGEPWCETALVAHAGLLLDSFRALVGRDLVPRGGDLERGRVGSSRRTSSSCRTVPSPTRC